MAATAQDNDLATDIHITRCVDCSAVDEAVVVDVEVRDAARREADIKLERSETSSMFQQKYVGWVAVERKTMAEIFMTATGFEPEV